MQYLFRIHIFAKRLTRRSEFWICSYVQRHKFARQLTDGVTFDETSHNGGHDSDTLKEFMNNMKILELLMRIRGRITSPCGVERAFRKLLFRALECPQRRECLAWCPPSETPVPAIAADSPQCLTGLRRRAHY